MKLSIPCKGLAYKSNNTVLHRESGDKGAGFDTILGLSTTKPPKKLPAKLNQLARLTMNHLAASEDSGRSSVVTGNNRYNSWRTNFL